MTIEVGSCSALRGHDDDRCVHRLDDALGDASVHQLRDAGSAVRADDDQIDVVLFRVVTDHLVDGAFADGREVFDPGVGEPLGCASSACWDSFRIRVTASGPGL